MRWRELGECVCVCHRGHYCQYLLFLLKKAPCPAALENWWRCWASSCGPFAWGRPHGSVDGMTVWHAAAFYSKIQGSQRGINKAFGWPVEDKAHELQVEGGRNAVQSDPARRTLLSLTALTEVAVLPIQLLLLTGAGGSQRGQPVCNSKNTHLSERCECSLQMPSCCNKDKK